MMLALLERAQGPRFFIINSASGGAGLRPRAARALGLRGFGGSAMEWATMGFNYIELS